MKSPSSIDDFLHDASNIFHAGPAGVKVLLPESEDELREILKKANRDDELVTIAGSHTGLTGASVPRQGGVVVGMESMLSVNSGIGYEDDLQGKIAYRQVKDYWEHQKFFLPPGITLRTLQRILDSYGKWFPPNPTEQLAEIGSCVANNSSGSRSFDFGPVRNHVTSLRVVLPQGDVVEVKRGEIWAKDGRLSFQSDERKYDIQIPTYKMPEVKNSAGLYAKPDMDWIDLFVGSEGTLGVFTEIGIRTFPKRDIETALFFFKDEYEALDFVDAARKHRGKMMNYDEDTERIGFISLEFFDRHALNMAKTGRPIKGGAAVEVEYFEEDYGALGVLSDMASGSVDSWVNDNIAEFRHSIPQAVNEETRRTGTRKVNIDLAVPVKHFRKLYEECKSAGEDFSRYCGSKEIHYAVWGHAGDCNLHFNLIPRTQEELIYAERMYPRMISKAVQEYGGTLSAEHGVGKKGIIFAGQWEPMLLFMYGDRGLREIGAVKEVLDPKFLLNRGNMVPYGWGR